MNRILLPLFRAVALATLLITPPLMAQTAGNLTLTATIKNTGSGPDHWAVVWVTNATTGAFVRTIRRQSSEPRGTDWNNHCGSWYVAAGLAAGATNFTPGVDGFTGATATTYAAPDSPFTQVWSCKDASGNTLPDGNYKVWIQYAEDVDGQGPVTTGGIPWTKGANSYSSGTLTQAPNFTSLSVGWTPAVAATTVSVAVSPANVAEDAAANLVYTFTRSGATAAALTASFTVAGSATFGTDYAQSGAAGFSASTGTVTFAAGAATALVTLNPTVDTTVESDETAILTVTSGSGYTAGAPAAATGTITNDDATVSVAVSPASVAEDAAANLVYTFTRSGATAAALTASFTVAGSATFGTDYAQSGAAGFSASTGTVTFAAGAATALVTLDPTVDTTVESDETAILTVTSGSGYTAGAPTAATGTITNDDTTVSVPEIVVEQNAGNIADGGSQDFGSLNVGSNTSLSFTIKNTGNGDLTGLVVTKGGLNPDDFTVTSSPVAPVAGPNGTTVCTVQFAPAATGSRSATLQISNNDADEAPFDITLTGTGTFFDDFDPGITPQLWAPFGGGAAANSNGQAAGPGPTGNSLWFGGDGSRFATTQALDTRAGGGVSFQLALANGAANPWEAADPGEEVVLEYSNDGTNYVQFAGPYNNRAWQKFVLTIPAAAQTMATQFRFRQLANSGAAYDNWAIDDVQVGSSVMLAAEIAVEQPISSGLADGTSTVYFNLEGSDLSNSRTLTIRNSGTADLTGLGVTKDGTNANSFTLGSLGANILAPGAATTFTVTFTPGATGPRTAAIHIASNDADEPQFDIGLTGGVVPGSAFAACMMAANLPLAESGAHQTPQHDGVTNLLKYACNLDLSKPDVRTLSVGGYGVAGLPGGTMTGGRLRLEFLRRKASTNPGITCTPQFCSSIGSWVDVAGVLQGVSIDAVWERVVVDDPAPGPGQRFGRLKVVQAP